MTPRVRSPATLPAWLAILAVMSGCQEVAVQPLPVASVQIVPPTITLLEGEEITVSAILRGPGGELLGGRQVTWSTGNAEVARLPVEGRLRGVAPGITELHARSDGRGADASVQVLQGPTIGVSAASVALVGRRGAGSELLATAGITNAGNGVLSGLTAELSFSGGGSANALDAELSSTTAPSELRVRARVDALAPGIHQAAVHLHAPVAGNSPRTVLVTVEVQDAHPSIGLAPGSLAFAAQAGAFEPASQVLQVTNTGGGVLEGLQVRVIFEGGPPVEWLTAILAGPRAPTTVALDATARLLPAGSHRARVSISSAGATPTSREVGVVFNVSAPTPPREGR